MTTNVIMNYVIYKTGDDWKNYYIKYLLKTQGRKKCLFWKVIGKTQI